VGLNKPGLVFVTGPGDEGMNRKHNKTTILYGSRVPVGTIWDGASAKSNICPGDYVNHTDWMDINGVPRSQTGEGRVGEIWKGSSIGPTADGRLGIDFCAPGDSVFTTYNPKSYWATFRFNLIRDGKGLLRARQRGECGESDDGGDYRVDAGGESKVECGGGETHFAGDGAQRQFYGSETECDLGLWKN
jgi:hypothetical protein